MWRSGNYEVNLCCDRLPERGEVALADLSATVNCVKPGTGGGARSDACDDEAGRLIWQVASAVEAAKLSFRIQP